VKHSRGIHVSSLVRAAALVFFFALAIPAFASAQTVVSLEFDDGTADQVQAGPALASAGYHGTFFINSGRVGTTGYMTLSQIQALSDAGNEIGGHTVNHSDLPTLTTPEATREICQDRVALLADGFAVSDLAYPFGDTSSAVEADAAACGYNSARTIGGVVNPSGCAGCELAESIPPEDPFDTNTPDSIQAPETLAQIEGLVTQAEPAGGWVQLVMHHICTPDGGVTCDPTYSISPANLAGLLAWLPTQTGVSVQTVNQVIGGAVKPPVAGPAVALPPAGNLLSNPSLEDVATNANANGGLPTPVCFGLGQDGTNDGTGAVSSDAHTGTGAESVSITSFTSGDERLLSQQDLGGCAPLAQSGHKYVFSTFYHSTAPVTLETYLRTSSGAWGYWSDNTVGGQPSTPAVANYTQASFTTPAVPTSGVFDTVDNLSCPCTGIAVAVSLRQVGSFTADDLSLTDADITPPTVTLSTPADKSFVNGNDNVTVSATASAPNTGDPTGNGIRSVEFFDGATPIATSTTAPYTAVWNTSGDTGPQAISAVATDTAGNQSPAINPGASATVTVDPTAPSSTATALPSLTDPSTFTVPYTASDNAGGSGVASVDLYAKVPGASTYSKVATATDPGASGTFSYMGSGDGVYSFYTLATDKVGNVQATPGNLSEASTTLDSKAPSSTASAALTLTDINTMNVSYTASDNSGGSGVKEVDLYAKAPGAAAYSKVAQDTSGLASGTFTYTGAQNGTYSFYTRATDKAGNVQGIPAGAQASIVLDGVTPVSHASAPAFAHTPALAVSYTDSSTGSGVRQVDLYVKGPGAFAYSKAASQSGAGGQGTFSYPASAGDGVYSFYTLATSTAGRVQNAPASPDASTMLDTVAPSSQLSAPALSQTASLTLHYTAADNGSGLAEVDLYAKAPGATAYSKVAGQSTGAPTGTFSYTARAGNGTYGFYTLSVDKAGNAQGGPLHPALSVVDLNAPRAMRVQTSGQRSDRGRAGKGDSVTFTYSKTIKPGSVLAGWNGKSTAVRVSLGGKRRSVLSVWSANGRRLLALANPLSLGGSYTKSASVLFAAKMTQHGSSITVTLRTLISGTVSRTAVKAGTLTWTPSAGATDLAGAKASTRSVSAHGPAF
jgi:Polysaccharide deacetylase/Bacterial Ig domain